MRQTRRPLLFLAMAGCTLLIACGGSKPSTELISARAAYHQASTDEVERVAPDRLLSAQQALERAEAAFKEDAGSKKERTLAYVAERVALMTIAHAKLISAEADTLAAERRYKEELEKKSGRTQADLDRAKEQLRRREQALKRRERELSRSKTALSKTQSELEREREARLEAEAKAAAALASLEEIAKVKEEARGLVITLSGAVLFKSGKSGLLPIAEQQLGKVAEALLEQDESKQIVVEGHTDSRGSSRSNRELSQARAESVRIFLISRGVTSSRIIAVGKGEEEPIANNKSADGRANNRRVEIIVGK